MTFVTGMKLMQYMEYQYRSLPEWEKKYPTMDDDEQFCLVNADLAVLEDNYAELQEQVDSFTAEERAQFDLITRLREETRPSYERLWAHQTMWEE